MKAARIMGAAGRAMIRAGVVILLFVAYQLWGTGIHTDSAQKDLAKQFDAALAQQTATSTDPLPPTDTTLPAETAPTDIAPPENGSPVGQITIPAIGAEFYIVEGVTLDLLTQGPGHFPNTPLPGQPGNAALAGHRVTYKAPFNRLDELQPGDKITVTTLQGTFNYEVLPQPGKPGEAPISYYIVKPNQTEILDDKGDNRLTLMACHPKYSAAERIVVEAKLVSEPAPPTPRPETTEATDEALPGDVDLAGGDPTARVPALAWTAAMFVLWFATWLVGHRHRRWKWPAYAVALPFFLLLMYASFENITRLLPGAF